MLLATLLVVLTVVGPFLANAALSRHQLELKEHYEHINKIMEFGCDLPQQRLLNVHELFSDSQTHGKAYFPEVTLLHRCDRQVGSCDSSTYRCGPTDSSEISLPFMVTFLQDMGIYNRGESVMEYYTLLNHTKCGCLKTHRNTSYVPVYGSLTNQPMNYSKPSSYNVTKTFGDIQTTVDQTSKPFSDIESGQNLDETDKEAKQKPGSTECQSQYFQTNTKKTTKAPSTDETKDDSITIVPEDFVRIGEDDNRLAKPKIDSNTVEPLYFESRSESSIIDLSKLSIFKGLLVN